jgi:hypothetical protein
MDDPRARSVDADPSPPPPPTAGSLPDERARRILLETARQLAGSLEPAAIFARMLASVRGAMVCDGMIASSYDAAEGVIRCQFAWVGGNDLDPATLPPLACREDGGGMQSQVIRSRRPMLFGDVAQRVQDPKGTYFEVDPEGHMRSLRGSPPPQSRSAIMAPLLLEGEVVGVIQVMAERSACCDRRRRRCARPTGARTSSSPRSATSCATRSTRSATRSRCCAGAAPRARRRAGPTT